ncbi:MAG: hypothetical protein WCL06_10310 [Bacteroidota bacterium]
MNDFFNLCVHILKVSADFCGMTYQEINVWLFVIIHPVVTLVLFILWLISINKNRKLKTQIKTLHYEKK